MKQRLLYFLIVLVPALEISAQESLFVLCKYDSNLELVEWVIDEKKELNTRDTYGFTPLMIAVMYSAQADMVELLLNKGADINAQSGGGYTPIMLAVLHHNDLEVVRTLLDYHPDLAILNKQGLGIWDLLENDYIRPSSSNITQENLVSLFRNYRVAD